MSEKIIVQKRPPKSPAAAGILSGLFPGAGQLYNGEPPKALLFFVIFAGAISMMGHGPGPFIPLLFSAFYIYQIIEAVQTAKSINQKALEAEIAAAGGAIPAEAPRPAKPEPRGSVFWGLVLMGLGGIFLLVNFNIIDSDRIWDFWPVAIIVIGIKLIFDFFRKSD